MKSVHSCLSGPGVTIRPSGVFTSATRLLLNQIEVYQINAGLGLIEASELQVRFIRPGGRLPSPASSLPTKDS